MPSPDANPLAEVAGASATVLVSEATGLEAWAVEVCAIVRELSRDELRILHTATVQELEERDAQ